jgi:serine/threonine-protein kinase
MSDVCTRCGARYPAGRLRSCPVCLLETELPPAILGDHLELLEEVGRGGMGVVYKARDLRLGRIVAVKFLPAEVAADEDSEKRFEREARALARLGHPGIVAVHELERDETSRYIVMEYVEGASLAERLPLPVEEAVAMALQVADALAFAHAQGIVHRDVKPGNILIDAAGRVRIADFGLARAVAREEQWTVTSADRAVGTPAYMAPEALDGAAPDARMDVYSLGVVLYETVTGHRPTGAFEPPPAPLRDIVSRALAPDPARRYPTMAAMRRDLAAVPSSSADLAPDERHWLWAAALLLTLATAAALWAFLLSVSPRVVAPGEVHPLIMVGTERLADGRIVSRARFETGPALAAIGMVVLAVLGYGALRRHWRETGLDRPLPSRRIRETGIVLAWGLVAVAVWSFRLFLLSRGMARTAIYIPLLGGVIELGMLFFVWVAVLEARRTSRPLRREPALWAGMGLALVPPITELARYLTSWRP